MQNVRSITPNDPADFTPELGNYKTLQPFRYWCQKVLPLVYDDSLSYYELLCKVVDYLNKAMEDVETLHGDVTNLHTAYDELQSYVNNYFSTLDVQEEINNKLDNMASNGELYEIIRRYTDPIVNEQNEQINVLKARKVDIENAKVHKKLYGIKDNACILRINKNGESAPVMGFTEESEISSYSSRDEVGISNMLKSDITNLLTPTTFTSESVILSEIPSNVKIGMIIDAINMVDIDAGLQTNKYSGFITDFADNVIYVSGWYKYGDTSKGQIPNTDTVVINPCTHLWNENNVINLLSNGYANIGIVAECNLYNHKYESNPEKYSYTATNGYDVLSNAGRSEFAFRARALNGFFVEGFKADKCNTGFVNSKSINNGFQSNNSEKSGFVSNQDKLYGFRAIQNQEGFVAENPQNVGFHSSNSQIGFCSTDDIVSAFKTSNGKFNISGDGLHTCFFEKIMTQGSKNSNIVPSNSTIFLLTDDATYTVPNAEDYTNCHVRIVPMTDGVVLNFENCRLSPPDGSESVTTYTCTKRKTLNLISLNGFWYAI